MTNAKNSMIGKVIGGKYKLLAELGKGGMGKVYLAQHLGLENEVAIKIIKSEYADNADFLLRFRREAQAAARVRHRNVVAIYDYDAAAEDSLAYIVMELLGGKSLHELIEAEGALEIGRAVELMSEICAGVGAAHKQKMLHRDIKPQNVMIVEDEEREAVKVLDFGLVKLLDENATPYTLGGQIMGSPPYMSPEMWRSKPDEIPDLRADVYSLGVTFYQMLIGKLPFHSDTPFGWAFCHLSEPPAPLPAAVPPELIEIIERALEKDREKRFASALEMRRELVKFQQSGQFLPTETGAKSLDKNSIAASVLSGDESNPPKSELAETEYAASWDTANQKANLKTQPILFDSSAAGAAAENNIPPAELRKSKPASKRGWLAAATVALLAFAAFGAWRWQSAGVVPLAEQPSANVKPQQAPSAAPQPTGTIAEQQPSVEATTDAQTNSANAKSQPSTKPNSAASQTARPVSTDQQQPSRPNQTNAASRQPSPRPEPSKPKPKLEDIITEPDN